jgi:hypothetical protein
MSARRPVDINKEDEPDHVPFFSLCLDSSRSAAVDVGAIHSTILPLLLDHMATAVSSQLGVPDGLPPVMEDVVISVAENTRESVAERVT